MAQIDTFKTRSKLTVGASSFDIFSLAALRKQHPRVAELPHSMKVLLENLLRWEDGRVVRKEHIEAVLEWDPKADPSTEISFSPARVLLQDFTGVPVVVDLAAMREALVSMGGKAGKVNPLCPLDPLTASTRTDLVSRENTTVTFPLSPVSALQARRR